MALSSPKLPLLLLLITTSVATVSGGEFHELLASYGLPKGLFPENVESFTFNKHDNSFSVSLPFECLVYFRDITINYNQNVTGKIEPGKLTDLSGLFQIFHPSLPLYFGYMMNVTVNNDRNGLAVVWERHGVIEGIGDGFYLRLDEFEPVQQCSLPPYLDAFNPYL